MSNHRKPFLTTNQLKAIELIHKGKTHDEIGKILKVNKKTIQRWNQRQEFVDALDDVCNRTTELLVQSASTDVVVQIERLRNKALNSLEAILDDPLSRNNDKIRTCQILGTWTGLQNYSNPEQEKKSPEDELNYYLETLDENWKLKDRIKELENR